MEKQGYYAPVAIPTLCRFEHFKRCIDSLSKCKGAECTDLFIALDYPAKESHYEGYEKIKSYIPEIHGFKQVVILERDKNWGVHDNSVDLIAQIRERNYPSYIFSEDDNEFSPDFLLYMNQCLEKYNDNPDVASVAGYSFPEWSDVGEYPFNAFPMFGYCAFGVGRWFQKEKDFYSFYSDKEIIDSPALIRQLFKEGQYMIVHRMLFRHDISGADLRRVMYAVLKKKYTIFPSISKVRNHGFDKSASHCVEMKKYENQVIDESADFCLDDFELKQYEPIQKLYRKHYSMNGMIRLLARMEYAIYRKTGKCFDDFKWARKAMRMRAKISDELFMIKQRRK